MTKLWQKRVVHIQIMVPNDQKNPIPELMQSVVIIGQHRMGDRPRLGVDRMAKIITRREKIFGVGQFAPQENWPFVDNLQGAECPAEPCIVSKMRQPGIRLEYMQQGLGRGLQWIGNQIQSRNQFRMTQRECLGNEAAHGMPNQDTGRGNFALQKLDKKIRIVGRVRLVFVAETRQVKGHRCWKKLLEIQKIIF